MTNYKLKILRNGEPVVNYNAAISILDNFKGHYVGQPIAIVYFDDSQNRKLLLAVGKRDCENDQIDGRNYGSEFYEIINNPQNFLVHYTSLYPLTTTITNDIGGIEKDTTLASLLNETDNGDISRILDLMFFGSSVVHPTVVDPSIVTFNYNGQTEIYVSVLPDVHDFYIETSRGSVSYGKIGDEYVENVPFSGTVSTSIEILDTDGNPVLNTSSTGDFIFRLYATFEDGEVTPMNSDNTVFRDPWIEQTMTRDVIVHVVQSIYAGVVDIDTGLTLFRSSMSTAQKIEYLINNHIILSFPSANRYNIYGSNQWGFLFILSPYNCSCKFQGDAEIIQHFNVINNAYVIDDIPYKAFFNIYNDDEVGFLDDMTYYSNDASYFYEISKKDE